MYIASKPHMWVCFKKLFTLLNRELLSIDILYAGYWSGNLFVSSHHVNYIITGRV